LRVESARALQAENDYLEDARMNFFNWIRDGVRQAVLLGVNDAVGDLGTPHEGDDISHRLLETIRSGGAALPIEAESHAPRSPARKKLGRSLEQIQASAAKAG
jgi:hypothetical protein